MSFLNVLQNRYTTKKYDASKNISDVEINELKEILQLSPSSINSQPWRFDFVSGAQVKSELADVSFFNKEKVLNASHLVVFSAIDSIAFFEKQIEENLPEGAVGYYNQFLKNKSEEEVKAWMSHQVYIALGVFLSACATMRIDSTPMEGILPESYASILKLENHLPLFAVAIGYRDSEDANQPEKIGKSRLDRNAVVFSI